MKLVMPSEDYPRIIHRSNGEITLISNLGSEFTFPAERPPMFVQYIDAPLTSLHVGYDKTKWKVMGNGCYGLAPELPLEGQILALYTEDAQVAITCAVIRNTQCSSILAGPSASLVAGEHGIGIHLVEGEDNIDLYGPLTGFVAIRP